MDISITLVIQSVYNVCCIAIFNLTILKLISLLFSVVFLTDHPQHLSTYDTLTVVFTSASFNIK